MRDGFPVEPTTLVERLRNRRLGERSAQGLQQGKVGGKGRKWETEERARMESSRHAGGAVRTPATLTTLPR